MKWLIIAATDILCIYVAFWGAFFLRLDSTELFYSPSHWYVLFTVLPISIVCFWQLGIYKIVLRYAKSQFIWKMIIACATCTVIFILLSFYFRAFLPRSSPIIFFFILAIFVCGSRLIFRSVITEINRKDNTNVVIYGAGKAGRQLANSLESSTEYCVVSFIDDDKAKQNMVINGVQVNAFKSLAKLIRAKKVEKVLLALPNQSYKTRNDIIERLQNYEVIVQSIPRLEHYIEGKITARDLKDIELDDLLGRESVQPKDDLLKLNVSGKNIIVSGAGGSIGSELCRQILKVTPKCIILLDACEFALYAVEQELRDLAEFNQSKVNIIPILGSVLNKRLLSTVLTTYKVNTFYHAAAYKHVPLVEGNVIAGIENNVFGTYAAASESLKANVDTFVLVSTDKAVRPTNVMGATKRLAELILQAFAAKNTRKGSTKFCMVRFGNVLGSSGSVIPLFRSQIKNGGPVTLTHPDITRYFMSIAEASQLVIQAGAMSYGGDVFVLDMGEPVKIKSLAETLIRLSGLSVKSEDNPNGDIEIIATKLRPGEKLYEELLVGTDTKSTEHPRILRANEISMPYDELEKYLNKLKDACSNFEYELISCLLLSANLSYSPSEGLKDALFMERSIT